MEIRGKSWTSCGQVVDKSPKVVDCLERLGMSWNALQGLGMSWDVLEFIGMS